MPATSVQSRSQTTVSSTNREESVRLVDLPSNNTTVKTHSAAQVAINNTDQPYEIARMEPEKITFPPLHAIAVEDASSTAGIGTTKRLPDFAFGVIKIATLREQFGSDKLKALAAQVRENLGDIDLLLELTSECSALPEKDSHNVSDKMRKLIGTLEIHKILVWKGGDKISRDQLRDLKAQLNSQIDKVRTSMQTKISTEIQPEATNLQSIMNIVQQIIQSDARLKRKTTEVPR